MSAEAVAVRDAPSAVVRPRRAPSFWRSATNSALTVALLAVLALAIALAVVPRLMGGAALTVLTGSMEPTYSPGDMVVSVPQDRYEIGDVVTYQPVSDDPTLITHRVVAVRELPGGVEYITRGDANGADDDPIVDGQVMGEVIYDVPYIGHLAAAVGENRSGAARLRRHRPARLRNLCDRISGHHEATNAAVLAHREHAAHTRRMTCAH